MPDTTLSRRLERALDGSVADGPQAVCKAAVAILAASGYGLASVYLVAGDRLRCMAVSGYEQLYDGIVPAVGVIGRAFVQGRAVRVRTARGTGYRAAAASVAEELAVPLFDGRTCVGVLNVETRGAFSESDVAVVEDAGWRLAAAVAAAGGPPAESVSQRLVRWSTVMADFDEPGGLTDAMLRAAVDLTGYRSAALLGSGRVLSAAGPAAEGLRSLPVHVAADALRWVRQGGSSRTSSDRRAVAGPAQAGLAAAGLGSFVLVPLAARGELLGGLVVGDACDDEADPRTVETLELLAALAAADLRSLRNTGVLRRQAATGDLTGLPHRKAFGEALDAALAGPARGRLAVLLVDLDGFKAVKDTLAIRPATRRWRGPPGSSPRR